MSPITNTELAFREIAVASKKGTKKLNPGEVIAYGIHALNLTFAGIDTSDLGKVPKEFPLIVAPRALAAVATK